MPLRFFVEGDITQTVELSYAEDRCCLGKTMRYIALSKQFGSLMLAIALVACQPTVSAPATDVSPEIRTMQLQSSEFSPQGTIPALYTCDGADQSPPLSWDDPPSGTQSLALIVEDPDAPRGIFVHWVIYNLPPETRQLPAAIPAEATRADGSLQGNNDFRRIGYGGPCPPRGTHRYVFTLYALDQPLALGAGATKAEVVTAMRGHILATAELIGHYERP